MKMERGYPTYTVTPKAENAIVKGHPWVYDAEILSVEGETANGGLVDVVSKKGRYLGTGFLSQQSKIRVRLISRNANDRFDEAFSAEAAMGVGLPEVRHGPGGSGRLPGDLWRGGRLPRSDGG